MTRLQIKKEHYSKELSKAAHTLGCLRDQLAFQFCNGEQHCKKTLNSVKYYQAKVNNLSDILDEMRGI